MTSGQYRNTEPDAVGPALRRQDPVGHAVSIARRRRQKTLSHAWWRTGLWCATRQ
jgi:hypothetical protein